MGARNICLYEGGGAGRLRIAAARDLASAFSHDVFRRAALSSRTCQERTTGHLVALATCAVVCDVFRHSQRSRTCDCAGASLGGSAVGTGGCPSRCPHLPTPACDRPLLGGWSRSAAARRRG
eukprot:1659199-Pleurochrysis_carterae.AAC.1